MPYKKRKQKCKQSDGTSGSYVLSYTTKKGEKRSACHTSKKNMQGQIAAIEGPREMDELDEVDPMMFGSMFSASSSLLSLSSIPLHARPVGWPVTNTPYHSVSTRSDARKMKKMKKRVGSTVESVQKNEKDKLKK